MTTKYFPLHSIILIMIFCSVAVCAVLCCSWGACQPISSACGGPSGGQHSLWWISHSPQFGVMHADSALCPTTQEPQGEPLIWLLFPSVLDAAVTFVGIIIWFLYFIFIVGWIIKNAFVCIKTRIEASSLFVLSCFGEVSIRLTSPTTFLSHSAGNQSSHICSLGFPFGKLIISPRENWMSMPLYCVGIFRGQAFPFDCPRAPFKQWDLWSGMALNLGTSTIWLLRLAQWVRAWCY